MYVPMRREDGEPPRLYRSAGEIRRDMERIGAAIEEAENMFNVRQMLIELLYDSEREGSEWLDAVEALIGGARRALDRLGNLRDALACLEEELEETQCLMSRRL